MIGARFKSTLAILLSLGMLGMWISSAVIVYGTLGVSLSLALLIGAMKLIEEAMERAAK